MRTLNRWRAVAAAAAIVVLSSGLGGVQPALGSGWPVIAEVSVCDAKTKAPIEGVEVRAWRFIDRDPDLLQFAGRQYTSSEGTCSVYDQEGCGAGQYRIEAWMNGYHPVKQEASWNGVDPVGLSIEMVPYEPIAEVRVVDAESGDPIAGAEVCAYFRDGEGEYQFAGSETADSLGTCTVLDEEDWGPGTYKIAAWAEGYEERAQEIEWDGLAPVVLTMELSPSFTVEIPIRGTDRIETAIQASQHSFPDGSEAVVIATAYNWPDALGASSLAGAAGGPMLLVPRDRLPKAVADEIRRLGARKIYVVGGTGAVSTAVEVALEAIDSKSQNVERIWGSDRYATSRKIASKVALLMQERADCVAFVATGAKFPDALCAAPIAAAKGRPILLVDPSSGVDAALVEALRRADITHVIVLGGTGVISDAVKNAIASRVPCTTERWGGKDRYHTAVVAAAKSVESGLEWEGVGVATGENFPDALTAGPALGKAGSALLLTKGSVVPSPVLDAVAANKGKITKMRIFGGLSVIPQATRDQLLQAAW